MLDSLGVKPQVVVVVVKEDAAFRVGVAKLNRVGGTEKPNPRGGRNINAPPAKPLGYRRIHVFVKTEANRSWHPLP